MESHEFHREQADVDVERVRADLRTSIERLHRTIEHAQIVLGSLVKDDREVSRHKRAG